MFSESKVTEIYCMTDDFCKEFTLQQEKYMIEDKKAMHRNSQTVWAVWDYGYSYPVSLRFQALLQGICLCKHLKYLFPRQVSYNRFVELEKVVLLPMTILTKKYCWEPVPASVLLTPLLYVFVVTKESLFIRHLRDLSNVENVQRDGSSDSSCIW